MGTEYSEGFSDAYYELKALKQMYQQESYDSLRRELISGAIEEIERDDIPKLKEDSDVVKHYGAMGQQALKAIKKAEGRPIKSAGSEGLLLKELSPASIKVLEANKEFEPGLYLLMGIYHDFDLFKEAELSEIEKPNPKATPVDIEKVSSATIYVAEDLSYVEAGGQKRIFLNVPPRNEEMRVYDWANIKFKAVNLLISNKEMPLPELVNESLGVELPAGSKERIYATSNIVSFLKRFKIGEQSMFMAKGSSAHRVFYKNPRFNVEIEVVPPEASAKVS